MSRFDITILGCGSALPTVGRSPSAQVVAIHEKLFLMDCGEGTQQKLRLNKVRMQRIEHICISHLHGDHYLGLMGLISTFNLLGREKPLTIIGPAGIKDMVDLHLRLASSMLQYPIDYISTNAREVEKVIDLETIEVISFPLKHKIPTTGFLFREQGLKRKINKRATDKHQVGVKDMNLLVQGEDLIKSDGTVIPNAQLTFDPPEARSYAYCSDTAYLPGLVDIISKVDVLYHEATFMNQDEQRAEKTKHSTAKQAALIAKGARAGRLLIGHFSARYTQLESLLGEAKEVFESTELAEERMLIEIPVKKPE